MNKEAFSFPLGEGKVFPTILSYKSECLHIEDVDTGASFINQEVGNIILN